MMREYISREAAIEALRECVRACPNSFYNGIEVARAAIRKMPASDVAPVVHGSWEELPPACNGALLTRCTTCRRIMTDVELGMVKRFCPNCGAKMDLEVPE